ncbi:DUF2946 domain-containing protein [Leptospira sp. 201903071]|uniref:DUF2946 domain-containing protein n=1 Tax=Leptospira ainazelensis TaxID=2810034 RepID=UPI001965CB12|nr:DUF2946 domain-containing protein [Leptospira ainazelensis]MBM9499086.1 DUF2946 domain-containing protein [Leptospira ainazelensis]
MSKKGLKVGILLLLLIGWMGREIHTHSEKEFRILVSQSRLVSPGDAKHSPACPVCQLQRNLSSLWNPDFLVSESSLFFAIENVSSSRVFILSFTISQIQLGRAPPLLFTT